MGSKSELNDAQTDAVNHENGPVLVVAGAGTGKTRVIIERLAKLIHDGVPKNEILCLTFTEKAAQEMLDRASEILEDSYGVELNIYTFNGFGSAILSEFGIEIGLSANQRLIGDNGKVVLLREHLDELELDYFAPMSRPDGQLANIADYFSKLKQQLVIPQKYTEYAKNLISNDDESRLEKTRHHELAHAYDKYIEICRSGAIIDYDDQIYLLVELLESRPNVLKVLQDRYKYIMVDEFQDTNPMQSRLIDLIYGANSAVKLRAVETVTARQRSAVGGVLKYDEPSTGVVKPKMSGKAGEISAPPESIKPGARSLMVVGDDDQSIYGWRGATLSNILDFTKRYPKAEEITLIENYRSTQQILDNAYQLIQNNNPERLEVINNLDKKLIAHRGKGSDPILNEFSNLNAELNWVAQDIKQRINDGIDPGQIAVLARRKQTVSKIHTALNNAEIEHTVAGMSPNLYKHPVVANLIEILRSIIETNNSVALFHALAGIFFDIDSYSLSQISADARATHTSYELLLKKSDDRAIIESLKMIDNWRKLAPLKTVGELSYQIITETGYKDRLIANVENDESSAETAQALGQWFNTLREFADVSTMPTALNYLDNLPALMAEGETISDDTVNITPNLPAVMTAHKAKGLEWEVVYIVDCTQGSFPLKPFGNSLKVPYRLSHNTEADDHYAEERRLMYVAGTRARDQLIITYSQTHNGVTKRKPSLFIDEMFPSAKSNIMSSDNLELNLFEPESADNKQIKLPGKIFSSGKVHLTASQADDYLTCPLNFYYKHVLNVPEPPSADTKIGSMFHGFLESINRAKQAGKTLPSLDEITEKLESEWPKSGFDSKAQADRRYKFSKKALKEMYERVTHDHIVPEAIEYPFNINLPDSNLVLNGRIDVVLPLGGGVEIRDYKTSTSPDTPEKAKSRVSSNNQLTIYALAWRLTKDEDPVQVSLDFVQTGQVGTTKKRANSLDTMQEKLTKAADDIIAGNFPPGAKHDFCIHPVID